MPHVEQELLTLTEHPGFKQGLCCSIFIILCNGLQGIMLSSDMSCQIMRSCIGTVTKLAVMHVGKAPKYEIRNLLFQTFHLIYHLTTFLKLYLFALDDLCPTPSEGPQNIKFTSRHVSVTWLHLPLGNYYEEMPLFQNPGFFHYF